MSLGNIQVRRATVDDVPTLRLFLEQRQVPAAPLEKKLTEFQLALAPSGIVGLVGMQLEKQQARIHTFLVPEPDPEGVRNILWDRVQAVARNHGLFRLWMQEPGWSAQPWPEATEAERQKLPESFGDRTAPWRVLQLKEESQTAISLDHEFELFSQSQRESSERMMRQAKVLKAFAYTVAALFVIAAGFLIFQAIRHQVFTHKR